jgi:hypothetical protein
MQTLVRLDGDEESLAELKKFCKDNDILYDDNPTQSEIAEITGYEWDSSNCY